MKLHQAAAASSLTLAIALPFLGGHPGIPRPAPSGVNRYVIQELSSASAEARREAMMTKGAGQQMYMLRAVALDDLIARLERGEPVSRDEIDRALRR